MKIDVKRLRELTEAAEALGYRVIHIHADVKNPPYPYVKLALQEREVQKKKKHK